MRYFPNLTVSSEADRCRKWIDCAPRLTEYVDSIINQRARPWPHAKSLPRLITLTLPPVFLVRDQVVSPRDSLGVGAGRKIGVVIFRAEPISSVRLSSIGTKRHVNLGPGRGLSFNDRMVLRAIRADEVQFYVRPLPRDLQHYECQLLNLTTFVCRRPVIYRCKSSAIILEI